MTKTLTYSLFAIASLTVILLFVTTKTYSQLAAGIVLYPALITASFGIFPRGAKQSKIAIEKSQKPNQSRTETQKPKNETSFISDIDKRDFIKLIGATGISFFLFSILGRRVDSLLGRAGQSVNNQDAAGNSNQLGSTGRSITEGYKISEFDEGPISYYGFTNKDGAWHVIREDSDGGSFRYAKGSSNFSANWTNRENLSYEYF